MQRNDNEASLPGWELYVDLNNSGSFNNGEPTSASNSAGTYRFVNVPTGNHRVRVRTNQTGWEAAPTFVIARVFDDQMDVIDFPRWTSTQIVAGGFESLGDLNQDGIVSPLDALQFVNEYNQSTPIHGNDEDLWDIALAQRHSINSLPVVPGIQSAIKPLERLSWNNWHESASNDEDALEVVFKHWDSL